MKSTAILFILLSSIAVNANADWGEVYESVIRHSTSEKNLTALEQMVSDLEVKVAHSIADEKSTSVAGPVYTTDQPKESMTPQERYEYLNQRLHELHRKLRPKLPDE
jgi:hypothetical protein